MQDAYEIVIDPFLLCLPNPCNTVEQLETFINSLLGWSGLIRSSGSRVLLADSALLALNNDDEFPHQHRLIELLKRHSCEIADDKTISQLANGILKRTPSFEDYYGIDTVLIDDGKITIEPSLLLRRLKKNCQLAFLEILTTISLVRLLKTDGSGESILVASALGNENINPQPDEIDFESEVHEIIFNKKNISFPYDLPYKSIDKIPISFSHEHLLSHIDLWEIWNHGVDSESAISAIETSIARLVESGISQDLRVGFTLGIHFLDSVNRWNASTRRDYAMVLIESCSRIVLGEPKNPLNEFRENSKSTSKQRIRDSDSSQAYRTHLTSKGVGLRLMIWKLPDGSIEFANIGGKAELIIL